MDAAATTLSLNAEKTSYSLSRLLMNCSRVVCLLFYFLATSKVISDRYQFVTVYPHGGCIAFTATYFPTQLHYPDTEITSPCLIILIPFIRVETLF